MIVICAFVAPNDEDRQKFRSGIGEGRFLMAYLSTPLDVCRRRNTDGIYKAADQGQVSNVPGITSSYEAPVDADIVLPTHEMSVAECIDVLMDLLRSKKRIG